MLIARRTLSNSTMKIIHSTMRTSRRKPFQKRHCDLGTGIGIKEGFQLVHPSEEAEVGVPLERLNTEESEGETQGEHCKHATSDEEGDMPSSKVGNIPVKQHDELNFLGSRELHGSKGQGVQNAEV